MIAWSYTPVTDAPPHPIATRFAQIMAALRAAVAIAAGPPPLGGPLVLRARRPLAPNLAVRLHQRLGKMMQVFAALVAHLTAFGADAPPRPPRRKPAPPVEAAAPIPQDTFQGTPQGTPQTEAWRVAAARPASPRRAPRLPGHAGWLAGLSAQTAVVASQLRFLLADPEALALLRASPALVQMLHPLCRMLGVALPAEVLPPSPPRPPRKPRRRRWRVPRRGDLLFLLRMGKPIPET